jgi:3-methyladenine DNA glycosylase AlkD
VRERQVVCAVRKELWTAADPVRALLLAKYFKTGPGQYGHGDLFIGITVPLLRRIAKQHAKNAEQQDIRQLVASPYHEERLVGLLLLVQMASCREMLEPAARLYLTIRERVNNWDLVDLSAPKILGAYLADKNDRSVLYDLARSKVVWDRRIAIISTFYLIRNSDFADALKISRMLLTDEHDLIHKAVGWTLREIGKRDSNLLESFILENYSKIPRTTLRYAIERFSNDKRLYLLQLKASGAMRKM